MPDLSMPVVALPYLILSLIYDDKFIFTHIQNL